MSELEEIKKRKLQELQNTQNQNSEEKELLEHIHMLETLAKQTLTKKAYERYTTIRLMHPENAGQLLTLIAHARKSGADTIDDDAFKDLARRVTEKKEFKINK